MLCKNLLKIHRQSYAVSYLNYCFLVFDIICVIELHKIKYKKAQGFNTIDDSIPDW